MTAYDSVNKERQWILMYRMGVSRMIKRIGACVPGSKCKVKYGEEEFKKCIVVTGKCFIFSSF